MHMHKINYKETNLPYSGKISKTLNFAVFKNRFTTVLKINSSKSYYSIESYDSLVDLQNLICKIYHGEITLKIFYLKNYPLYGTQSLSHCSCTQMVTHIHIHVAT